MVGGKTTLARDNMWRSLIEGDYFTRKTAKIKATVGKHDLGKFLVKTI